MRICDGGVTGPAFFDRTPQPPPHHQRAQAPGHAAALEAPYTPRYDFQGISDDTDVQAIMARLPQFTTAS